MYEFNKHALTVKVTFHMLVNNLYLSVSLGSLPYVTVDIIVHPIQCSLLLIGFTPQIANKKQDRYIYNPYSYHKGTACNFNDGSED